MAGNGVSTAVEMREEAVRTPGHLILEPSILLLKQQIEGITRDGDAFASNRSTSLFVARSWLTLVTSSTKKRSPLSAFGSVKKMTHMAKH